MFFGRTFWSCKYNLIKSHLGFQLAKEVSIISNVPNDPDSKKKKNDKEWISAVILFRTVQMGLLAKTLSYTEFNTSKI